MSSRHCQSGREAELERAATADSMCMGGATGRMTEHPSSEPAPGCKLRRPERLQGHGGKHS